MSDAVTGEGPWRVTLHDGHVMLVEIWHDNRRLIFGRPRFRGPCARCGTEIAIFTPDNDTMEVCDDCEVAMLADLAKEETP
jgi:hypothetical protein